MESNKNNNCNFKLNRDFDINNFYYKLSNKFLNNKITTVFYWKLGFLGKLIFKSKYVELLNTIKNIKKLSKELNYNFEITNLIKY